MDEMSTCCDEELCYDCGECRECACWCNSDDWDWADEDEDETES